jgi:hypothetical protein
MLETYDRRRARLLAIEAILDRAWKEVGRAGLFVPSEMLAELGAETFVRDGSYYDPYLHAVHVGTWDPTLAVVASTALRMDIEPYRHPGGWSRRSDPRASEFSL